MSHSSDIYINVTSQQRIIIKDTAVNVEKSKQVRVLPTKKKGYLPIPSSSSEYPVIQGSSPTCSSGLISNDGGHFQWSHQIHKSRQPNRMIQVSEITPNNIIRFLDDLGLNPNSLLNWTPSDVSKFLRHPYLNLLSYNILEYIWNRYCYQAETPPTCCFNDNNINGLTLIYICLGKKNFHYYTNNQFPDFHKVIKHSYITCKCTKKFIYDTKYDNGQRISYLVELICQCFMERQYMVDKLLSP